MHIDRPRFSALGSLMSKQILAVEDDAFLAMALAMDIEAAGHAVIGPFGKVAQVLTALDTESVDFAVLDLNLGNETSEPIATALNVAGIPFVVVSGYGNTEMTGAFAGAQSLEKPYVPDALIALLPPL
jgi:DNA-binding response OmpR family regulator